MDWQTRATQEKSLREVYWKARRVGSTRGNLGVAVLVSIVFCLLAVADWYLSLGVFSLAVLRALVSRVGEIGFSLTTAILGFLIAGFSIFASITRPAIFAGLARLDHKDSGLSRLQFIFFNFLLVFIHYLAFLAMSIFLKLVLPMAPAVVEKLQKQAGLSDICVWWVSTGLAALLLGWLAFLIMLLKSFIWNIYQAVLVVIVTGDHLAELEKKLSSSTDSKTSQPTDQ